MINGNDKASLRLPRNVDENSCFRPGDFDRVSRVEFVAPHAATQLPYFRREKENRDKKERERHEGKKRDKMVEKSATPKVSADRIAILHGGVSCRPT